uniref:Major facilitator superfamily domain-containing protein 10-like n=1 Tax=Saccoglossus kowalevskii TaxID=10224 RepID=A0ABM0GRP0_SACKO|nr:PREDICTED: major facilitator superfamily domain-containing protein 10-like [Saccoglossus kowalevskii]
MATMRRNSEKNGHMLEEKQPRTASDPGQKESPKMVYIVFVSLLIDLLGFTVILPLLPALLDYYAKKNDDSLYQIMANQVDGFKSFVGIPNIEKYNSVLFGGIISSLFSFLQFVVSPVLGAASDVHGRRPLMLASMIGIAISYCIWAVSHNFTVFLIARIIGGLSKANVNLSTAIIADVSTVKTRGKGMALIGVAFSLGFTFGPMIGAYFSKISTFKAGEFYIAPALFALSLAVLDIVFIYFFMKETLPLEKRAKSFSSSSRDAFNLISPFALFQFSAVKNCPDKGSYSRRIPAGSEKKTAVRGMFILMPAFIIIAFASNQILLYIGLALFCFASATVVPCMTTMVSSYGTVAQKGTVVGIFRSLGGLSRATGPIVASIVYWSVGSSFCYCIGGVLLLIPTMLLLKT